MRLAAALIVLAAGTAAAGTRDQLVDAERHWRELDYELCVAASDAVLAASDATPPERIEALRLRGSALVVLGRDSDAVAAFEALLEIDPDYELPDGTSPRILAVYQPARAGWQVKAAERLAGELGDAWAKLAMNVRVPARGRGGRPLVVPIQLADPGHITESLVLAYRRRGERHFSTLSAGAKSSLELAIPGATLVSSRDYTLEVFVRARHRSGATLRWQGDPDHPLQIPVTAGQLPRERWIQNRWLFAGTGLVIAGTIALLAIRARDVGPQPIVGHGP